MCRAYPVLHDRVQARSAHDHLVLYLFVPMQATRVLLPLDFRDTRFGRWLVLFATDLGIAWGSQKDFWLHLDSERVGRVVVIRYN